MELLSDFTTSIRKAFSEIDENYESYPGLVIAGTHTPENTEEMLTKIKEAREKGMPTLGICFGHQAIAIQVARDVLHINDATSEEFGKEGTFVVRKLPQLRVGIYPASLDAKEIRMESFWHNYEVDPMYFFNDLEKLKEIENLDLMHWDGKGWCKSTQFHPEYQSSKEKPHPILVEFLTACKNHGRL